MNPIKRPESVIKYCISKKRNWLGNIVACYASAMILIIVLFSASLPAPVCSDSDTPLNQALAFIKTADYGKSIQTLRKAMQREQDIRTKTRLKATLALVSMQHTGNYDDALNYYQQILSLRSTGVEDIQKTAAQQIAFIESLRTAYKHQDLHLKKIKQKMYSRIPETEVKTLIHELNVFINDNTDYYKLHEAVYYSGLYYMKINTYSKAVKAFEKAISLKPAIDFYLPVTNRLNSAIKKRDKQFLKTLSQAIAGMMLFITMITFYASRPHTWFGFRPVLIGMTLIGIWAVVYHLFFYIVKPDSVFLTETIQQQLSYEKPMFFLSLNENLGENPLTGFLNYGLICLSGILIFSASSMNLPLLKKKFKLTVFINTVYSALAFISVLLIFSYNCHYTYQCEIVTESNGVTSYLTGSLFYRSKDPKPYLLTAPKDYPALNYDNISDNSVKEWLLKYDTTSTTND